MTEIIVIDCYDMELERIINDEIEELEKEQ